MLKAHLAQLGPRVLLVQRYRAPAHNLSLEHKDPRDLRGHQGRMASREGMVNQATLVKTGGRVTLDLKASRGPQEMWALRVRREILVLGLEDLQDLRDHQDPPSDRTS